MNVLTLILSAVGALYGLWFVLIAVLGSLKRYEKPPHAPKAKRFAVIVPARNEAGVVGHLVRSLMNQSYPKEAYDIFVIPNGCVDDTANVARSAGARVLPCEETTHSKGDVLRFAFSRPELQEYDAYCILDADNLAAPGFLRAANDAMSSGAEIVQGYRDSKNPADSWVAGSTSVFFWMMNRFYNRARASLNRSAALNGTGIIVSSALIRRIGWNVASLTEDLELSGLCAIHGVKIGYAEDAVIYDEQPRGLKDSMIQRRRWFSGGMQCFRILGARLVRTHSFHALDMLMIFSGWIVQIVSMIPGVIGAYGVIRSYLSGALDLKTALIAGAAALALSYIACALFALLILVGERKLSRRMVPTILLFPLFLVTWMPANLWAMVTRPPKWTQIAHVRSVDAPDL